MRWVGTSEQPNQSQAGTVVKRLVGSRFQEHVGEKWAARDVLVTDTHHTIMIVLLINILSCARRRFLPQTDSRDMIVGRASCLVSTSPSCC